MKIKTKQLNTKPSGIEWVGDIPESWKVLPVRALLEERKEKNKDGDTDNILSVMKDVGVIRYDDKGNIGNKSSDRPESYKVVHQDDIVLNSMNLVIGSVGIANEPGVTSSVYIIYKRKRKEDDVRYFLDLFRTKSFQRHLGTFGKGIMELRESVKEQDIRSQRIPVPPPLVQKNIVNFVDEKIPQIDSIIEKKQKLIELLKEKRISVITKAVTKGLDSKVKMKPSDVRWFDNIPHHWDIRKVKFLITDNDGGVWGEADDPDGQPVLRSTEITAMGKWRINEKEIAYRSLTESEISKGLLKENDLLVTKSSGSEEHIGKTAIVTAEIANKRYCYSNFMQRLRSNNLVNPKILYYFMNSYVAREQYNYLSNSTIGLGNLNADVLNSLYFLLIPPEEQEEIITYLDKAIEEIDLILDSFTKQIEKLREYRASVIYSAVTGKIEI